MSAREADERDLSLSEGADEVEEAVDGTVEVAEEVAEAEVADVIEDVTEAEEAESEAAEATDGGAEDVADGEAEAEDVEPATEDTTEDTSDDTTEAAEPVAEDSSETAEPTAEDLPDDFDEAAVTTKISDEAAGDAAAAGDIPAVADVPASEDDPAVEDATPAEGAPAEEDAPAPEAAGSSEVVGMVPTVDSVSNVPANKRRKKVRNPRLVAQRAKLVALFLLFLAGVGFAAYPFISNFMYQHTANAQLDELAKAVDAGDKEAFTKELEDARVYNEDLVGQTVPDVFAIREGTTDEDYESFLNVRGDLMMGSVEIPVINVNLPIYHYSTEESLLKGVGHIFGSSLPVGGESSHSVLTAHRGLPAAKLFTDLDQLQLGDRFYVKVLHETMAYEVDNIEIVAPSETRSLAIKRGEDLVTLVTCTPYGVNTDRLLVRGHRVPYEPKEETKPVIRHSSQMVRALLQVLCVVLGVAAALVLRARNKRRRENGAGKGSGSRGTKDKARTNGMFYE